MSGARNSRQPFAGTTPSPGKPKGQARSPPICSCRTSKPQHDDDRPLVARRPTASCVAIQAEYRMRRHWPVLRWQIGISRTNKQLYHVEMARLLLCLMLTFAHMGCQQAASPELGDAVKIQVLGFAGCPNTPAFRERVTAAAKTVGGFDVLYIDQESLPEDDLRRGYPTPTALVDDEDLFGLPAPTSPSMGCRMYPGGLPSVDEIESQLRAVRP